MITKTHAHVTVVLEVELDVDKLVEQFGPNAKSMEFLAAYAATHPDGKIVKTTFDGFIERGYDLTG